MVSLTLHYKFTLNPSSILKYMHNLYYILTYTYTHICTYKLTDTHIHTLTLSSLLIHHFILHGYLPLWEYLYMIDALTSTFSYFSFFYVVETVPLSYFHGHFLMKIFTRGKLREENHIPATILIVRIPNTLAFGAAVVPSFIPSKYLCSSCSVKGLSKLKSDSGLRSVIKSKKSHSHLGTLSCVL